MRGFKMGKWLTIKETAERLRVSRSVLYYWVSIGYISHFKIGATIRFSEENLEEFQEAHFKEAKSNVSYVPRHLHYKKPTR